MSCQAKLQDQAERAVALSKAFPWSAFVASCELIDELGGDPYDVDSGDVVINAGRELRVVLQTYGGSDGGNRYRWLDPATCLVHDHGQRSWADWAGEQLWFLSNPDGESWELRSPFDDAVEFRQ